MRSALSLRIGCLCKERRGRRGPVDPRATNIAEAVCTAWLIISWKVYRCYTRDDRGGEETRRVRGRKGRMKGTKR